MKNFRKLGREEMKQVIGGVADVNDCSKDEECPCGSGKTCHQVACSPGSSSTTFYGICV